METIKQTTVTNPDCTCEICYCGPACTCGS